MPRRPTCARCRLPASTCLCGWVRPVEPRTAVLVLQHPGEVDQAKGSARLLALSLRPCQVEVGEVFDPAALARWCEGAVLLYPPTDPALGGAGPPPADAAGALDAADADHAADTAQLSAPIATPAAPPRTLVVLDATWRKSLRMLLGNPLLRTLPRLSLPDAVLAPPAYAALRRAPRPGQLSTLEATCAALRHLEGHAHAGSDGAAPNRYAPLLEAFAGWVGESAARRPPDADKPTGTGRVKA